ncbi:hypothetical protein B566_EDAN016716 [Ephemera danica]|nr:hypothetical protein B566_EDAN016716 [Ephemera danica]
MRRLQGVSSMTSGSEGSSPGAPPTPPKTPHQQSSNSGSPASASTSRQSVAGKVVTELGVRPDCSFVGRGACGGDEGPTSEDKSYAACLQYQYDTSSYHRGTTLPTPQPGPFYTSATLRQEPDGNFTRAAHHHPAGPFEQHHHQGFAPAPTQQPFYHPAYQGAPPYYMPPR